MHGGSSVAGIASPRFTTGRYSQHLPSRLLATFEESARDPNLLALDREIALIDSRLAELVGALDSGESSSAWTAMADAYAAYKKAAAVADVTAMKTHLDAIGDAIGRAAAEGRRWDDIRAALETRRKLVETERRRLVDMQTMVTAQEAAALVRSLVESVRAHVRDADVLAAISADLERLAPPPVC